MKLVHNLLGPYDWQRTNAGVFVLNDFCGVLELNIGISELQQPLKVYSDGNGYFRDDIHTTVNVFFCFVFWEKCYIWTAIA